MTPRRFAARRLAPLVLLPLLATPGCSLALQHANGGIELLEQRSPAPVGVAARGGKYLGWLLGAPLAVALLPVGLLAALTPWVDLADAVDLASAPAIGAGYLTEAAVGYPVYGALRLADPRPGLRPAARREVAQERGPWDPPRGGLPWGLVNDHWPGPRAPRAAAPLPLEVAEYYAVPSSAVSAVERALSDALAARGLGPARATLGGASPATVELYLSSEPGPRPLVLLTPPNRVTSAARYLASWLTARGAHAAVLVPEGTFLEPGLPPELVEAKLRASVIGARAVLAALARRPEVDPARLRYLGISAGAIFGSVLVAVEPRITRAVLWLPGGDLGSIVAASVDREVRAYRESWEERGVTPEQLAAQLARAVRTDPLRLARHVDPRRLLIVLGADDRSVPTANGLALHEAMGRPEAWMLAGRHASAVALGFGFLLRESAGFLLR